MSDESGGTDPAVAYWAKLKLWGLGLAAAVAYLVLGALVNRWIGPQPSLPAPPMPGVVVVSAGGEPVQFHVVRPE